MESISLSGLVRRRAILVFGDSITQQGFSPHGWVSRLAWEYQRKADVINRGLSGYNSRQGLQALPYVFPAPSSDVSAVKPFALSTIFFGANDATDAASAACQHCPLDEYRANIAAIVETAARVSEVVVVLSPPAVDRHRWPDRCMESAKAYATAAADAVKAAREKLGLPETEEVPAVPSPSASFSPSSTGSSSSSFSSLTVDTSVGGTALEKKRPIILFIDLFSLCLEHKATATAAGVDGTDEASEPAWFELLSDGLHLSAAGNALVFDSLMKAVRTHAPHLAPEALQWDLPMWKALGNLSPSHVTQAMREHRDTPKAAIPKPGEGPCCCGKH